MVVVVVVGWGGGGLQRMSRWAHLLKQQSSITVYCLPTGKTNFHFPFQFAANNFDFLFAAKKWKLLFSVNFTLYLRNSRDMETSNRKQKMEDGSPGDFSLIHLPFVLCSNGCLSFVDEETNGSYPFSNRLNR